MTVYAYHTKRTHWAHEKQKCLTIGRAPGQRKKNSTTIDDFYPILISTTISYGIVENVIRELNEQNPYKYFVLSPYSNKSQQYGIFVVNEVGNLDMDAKTRKTMFSGK